MAAFLDPLLNSCFQPLIIPAKLPSLKCRGFWIHVWDFSAEKVDHYFNLSIPNLGGLFRGSF